MALPRRIRGRKPERVPRKPYRYRIMITDYLDRRAFIDFDDLNQAPFRALQCLQMYLKKLGKTDVTLRDLLYLSNLLHLLKRDEEVR